METTITCKQEAVRWVHRYAMGGAVFAALPIPMTTTGLATLETHMASMVGEIYGAPPSGVLAATTGGALTIMGQGLKWIAERGSKLLPWAGPLVRMAIAAAAIEGIGHGVVGHYERKHPGKVFSRAG